uniref:Uncharacterized protein n=1 Tax=Sipha flava TaxID=143950 RepID=A0A2S2Q7H8_9HEMI
MHGSGTEPSHTYMISNTICVCNAFNQNNIFLFLFSGSATLGVRTSLVFFPNKLLFTVISNGYKVNLKTNSVPRRTCTKDIITDSSIFQNDEGFTYIAND